jgi:hypothetical protein
MDPVTQDQLDAIRAKCLACLELPEAQAARSRADRPLGLVDVLLAMGATERYVRVTQTGRIMEVFAGSATGREADYDLSNDSLYWHAQFRPRTIAFIHSMLCSR